MEIDDEENVESDQSLDTGDYNYEKDDEDDDEDDEDNDEGDDEESENDESEKEENEKNFSNSTCNINDKLYYDEPLIEIFKYFNFEEKLQLEKVCTRWRNIINNIMEKETVLFGGHLHLYELKQCIHHEFKQIHKFGELIKDKDHAVSIFSKVPKLKSLYLADHLITNCIEYLETAVQYCPELQCINLSISQQCPIFDLNSNGYPILVEPATLDYIQDVYDTLTNKLGCFLINGKIKHFSFDIIPSLVSHQIFILRILVSYLIEIQRLTLTGRTLELIFVHNIGLFTPSIKELVVIDLTLENGYRLLNKLIHAQHNKNINLLSFKFNDINYNGELALAIYNNICDNFIELTELELGFDFRYKNFFKKYEIQLSSCLIKLEKLKNFKLIFKP